MQHHAFAFLSVCAALIFVFWSFRQYQKHNFQFSAFLLVLAALVLRIFVASDLYLHEWDERYHALVAKNLMNNFLLPKLYPVSLLPYNINDWSSNYIWLHKQPFPLWCMALSLKIFGVNEWSLRVPSVLVSSVAVYLTYFIGKKLFSEQIGLLAAFFHTISGIAIEMTGGRISTDHIDIFFLFTVQLAVVCAIFSSQKGKMYWNILTGACIGLGVLCKWLPAFIALLVWLTLNYDNTRKTAVVKGAIVTVLSAVAVFVPWQIYMYFNFPNEYSTEMLLNYRHMTEVLDGQGGSIFYFFNKLFITLNEFIWVAFAWFCYKLWQRDLIQNRLALFVWVVVPFIFFSSVNTKMQGYLLFTYPALFIILSSFCIFLLNKQESIKLTRLYQLVFAVVVFLSIRYSIERIKPLQDQSKQLLWAEEFRKIDKNNAGKRVYVNVKHYIEGMFYTNSIMYGYIPSQSQIDAMKAKGYDVIINQNPEL